jgi:alginate O-acetyltransferase complex protein AlgI
MLFNSIEFAIFFPIVTAIYFFLPYKYRWLHLLVASCIFYMAFVPAYILVLFFTIIIDYYAGIWIEKTEGKKRKLYLTCSIIANVGVLAIFKYFNFFIDNINAFMGFLSIQTVLQPLGILLPIGLSFHTFQAMSYTIEVYRGNQKAEKHFGIYALYVMFYPQLVAGPIERPQNVIHQFYEKFDFDYDRVVSGIRLMLWGLFKKVVIADRIAILTDATFNNPKEHEPVSLLIASVFFSFQIFCDFSGYSDIALGSARVMGFDLMRNFNRPYQAQSISEFWKRWHISLSTWFRDYLYISLGGNRVSVARWYFNLFFVFLVSGFWHGANWTFVIWGALHGFYLIFALIFEKYINFSFLNAVPSPVRRVSNVAITFFLVTFAWIFFRANNVNDAIFIIKKIAECKIGDFKDVLTDAIPLSETFKRIDLLITVLLILTLETVHYFQSTKNIERLFLHTPKTLRWSVYYFLILIILILGVFENRNFIYFQF